jgi:2',3'-cyclic-nucleotide 2'-phosphodiesterase (5'-nucleotidase family)
MKLRLFKPYLRLTAAALVGLFVSAAVLAQKPQPAKAADVHAAASETLIDSSIPDDPSVDQMLAAYSPKVSELDTVIGTLKGDLRKGGIGAGSLGNFVTDGLLAEARKKAGKSIVMAITNGGGLRKNAFSEGDLRVRDMFELLPFENALVQFDLTGEQLLKLLNVALSHRDAQAGARIRYRTNPDKKTELVSVRLLIDGKETEIDPAATYSIVSIDYLWKRRSATPSETEGDYSVLGQAKKIQPLGLTMRDAMIQYVKDETAAGRVIKTNLDGRFKFEKSEEPQP